MPSFSLKYFLVFVAFVGLVTATLSQPSTLMLATLGITVWASLVVTVISAVIGGVPKRAFAAGYTIAGTAFLALAMGPPANGRNIAEMRRRRHLS